MNRYVEVEQLIANLDNGLWGKDWDKALAEAIIEDAPSIDICFCRECIKANTENCSHSYWDDFWGVWRIGYKGDDWFCADGERKGE